jgi:hypothetical protein
MSGILLLGRRGYARRQLPALVQRSSEVRLVDDRIHAKVIVRTGLR